MSALPDSAADLEIAAASAPRETGELTRSLGTLALVCLVVGQVVGIGIFLTPAEMVGTLGSSGLVHSMWLLMGSMALTGALCYGELASRFPQAGGAFVYIRQAWGRPAAFLYGWKCLLVMDPGLSAALATGFAQYVSFLTPLGGAQRKLLAIAVVVALAVLTSVGTRIATGVMVAITLAKLGILALIVGRGLSEVDGVALVPTLERSADAPALLAALAGGAVAAFFSYGGWWEAARMAGEVRKPQTTFPKAFVLAIVIVTVLYMVTSAVFMALVPAAESAEAFAAELGTRLFGERGGVVIAATVAVSVLGSLAAMMLAVPRLYLALARDGLFPRRLGWIHPRFGTPVAAIGVQVLFACLLVALGTFADIVAFFVFATILFIALSVAGLYRLGSPPEGTFRTPWRAATPAVFVGLCAGVLLLLLAGRPLQSLLGLAVVTLGIPVYHLFYANPVEEDAA